MATQSIPAERKALYYLGMVVMGAGVLLFLSNFLFVAGEMGSHSRPRNHDIPMSDPDWFEKSRARNESWFAENSDKGRYFIFRALGGMGLIAVGGFLMRIGAAGLAGSGIVLDPQKAREDLKPWSHMAGGMIQDAVSQVEVVKKVEAAAVPPAPVVKVRCRRCTALNDETARFCNQCAASL
jgi:hypothetical protein